jgi:hypothetical protein
MQRQHSFEIFIINAEIVVKMEGRPRTWSPIHSDNIEQTDFSPRFSCRFFYDQLRLRFLPIYQLP